MRHYSEGFYKTRHDETLYSAETIISHLLELLPTINSAVDVGCGIGTWLAVLKGKGVGEIQGIDGDWVNTDYLVIPPECFTQADLSEPIELERRFDLAISLEVAEHLPSDSAPCFIDFLTGLSDKVLFSAAIPHQGGTSHLNEQWPDYWARLFRDQGYDVVDVIRKRVWADEKIPFWYRQNILLYVKKESMTDLRIERKPTGTYSEAPLSVVHPHFYTGIVEGRTCVRGAWKLLCKALRNTIRRRLPFGKEPRG